MKVFYMKNASYQFLMAENMVALEKVTFHEFIRKIVVSMATEP